jgi:hypothetical protein
MEADKTEVVAVAAAAPVVPPQPPIKVAGGALELAHALSSASISLGGPENSPARGGTPPVPPPSSSVSTILPAFSSSPSSSSTIFPPSSSAIPASPIASPSSSRVWSVDDQPDIHCPYPLRLRNRLHRWRHWFPNEGWVHQLIEHGYALEFDGDPPSDFYHRASRPLPPEQLPWAEAEVEGFEERACIAPVRGTDDPPTDDGLWEMVTEIKGGAPPPDSEDGPVCKSSRADVRPAVGRIVGKRRCRLGEHISPIFFIPWKDGRARFIFDLRHTNTHLLIRWFKMNSLRTVLESVREGDYAVSIDIKDAYGHMPILPKHRRYLRFIWKGQVWEWHVGPFGLATLPRVFTKLMRVPIGYLRSRGIRILVYLDDILILASSRELCLQHRDMVIEMLLDLGFRFSWDKCDLVPTQEFAYLGLLWDTRPGVFTCLLPPKKLRDLRQLARRLARKRIVTPRMVLGLLGKLVACGAAAPSLAYTMRPLQLNLIRWMRFAPRRMWDCHVRFSRQARNALLELRVMLRHWNGRSLLPFVHTMEAYSDASDTGWGAHWTGGETQGNWTPEERALHITRRELLEVKFGLMALLDGLKGHCLLWRSDNTAVVSYINKMGGTKVPYMSKVALEIHRLADKHKISLRCLHIPGKENILADELSCRPLDRNDWKLNPQIFDMICARWKARPTLDLFATRLNYQVKAYFSRYPDPYAKGTDAFSQSWAPTSSRLMKGIDLTLLWANPLWTLIGRVRE